MASAMTDPAVFHLFLLCSAIHLSHTTHNYRMSEFIFHKTKVIQLVNQKLQENSEITDRLLLIVSNLAKAEVWQTLLTEPETFYLTIDKSATLAIKTPASII